MTAEARGGTEILIIDDEAIMRESIAVYLEDSGYTVSEASDGTSGLERVFAQAPDMVLLDLRMPGMDGLEVLSEIGARAPDVPVIVVTGAGGMQDAVAALRLGAFDFIAKPIIDMAVLEHAVRRGLAQRALVTENRRYRQGLEAEIQVRTQALRERSEELEKANRRLKKEIASGQRMAEALQHSESRLREVIALFEGYIYAVGKDYRIEFMNRRLSEAIGRDATGERCFEALYQGSGPCAWCPNVEVFRGRTERHEFRHPQNDSGDGRWYHAIHAPIVGADGKVARAQMIVMDITEHKRTEVSLKRSEAQLKAQTDRLRSSLKGQLRFGNIVGKSPTMQTVYNSILKAAESSANVIVYGESGTGKELVSRTIHELSHRGGEGFVTVNCGAIPENLLESEFFGYRKGAFTGAQVDKPGFLDAAHGGTLFLDEIGELPLAMQVKLLRAIEGGGFTPIGSQEVVIPDLRIIAATNRDLEAQMHRGRFRRDLFYRIHIIPIYIPPLRERRADIPLLAHHFLELHAGDGAMGTLPDTAMRAMLAHDWPGNVRELQNAVHRYLTLNELPIPNVGRISGPGKKALWDDAASQEDPADGFDLTLPETGNASGRLADVMRAFEKRYLEKVLTNHHWHRSRVARQLGVDRRTLFRKIKSHGIETTHIETK